MSKSRIIESLLMAVINHEIENKQLESYINELKNNNNLTSDEIVNKYNDALLKDLVISGLKKKKDDSEATEVTLEELKAQVGEDGVYGDIRDAIKAACDDALKNHTDYDEEKIKNLLYDKLRQKGWVTFLEQNEYLIDKNKDKKDCFVINMQDGYHANRQQLLQDLNIHAKKNGIPETEFEFSDGYTESNNKIHHTNIALGKDKQACKIIADCSKRELSFRFADGKFDADNFVTGLQICGGNKPQGTIRLENMDNLKKFIEACQDQGLDVKGLELDSTSKVMKNAFKKISRRSKEID